MTNPEIHARQASYCYAIVDRAWREAIYTPSHYELKLRDRSTKRRRANLRGADLQGAKGIVSFGPVGDERRIGFAMWHESKVHLRLGCFFGGEKEGLAAIREKYGKGDPYYTFARAACSELKLRHALPAKQREVA